MQKIMYFSLFDNHIWFSIKVEWTQVYNTSLFCLMLVVALCCQLPRQYKEKQRDYKVGKHHVDPDFKSSGDMKAKSAGSCFLGFLYRMLMPRVMKGLEKSTAFSLS